MPSVFAAQSLRHQFLNFLAQQLRPFQIRRSFSTWAFTSTIRPAVDTTDGIGRRFQQSAELRLRPLPFCYIDPRGDDVHGNCLVPVGRWLRPGDGSARRHRV